ncbi:MAG: AraC family transcriptional regulator [Lentisphaerae bacterium]|nr:MAG: AraC family transcriptional regulator [Lentisphaerota bacterium]
MDKSDKPIQCRWHHHAAIDNDFTLFTVSGNGFPLHTHDGFHEWMIVVEGRLSQRINGRDVVMEPGTAILVRESDQHELACGNFCLLNLGFITNWASLLAPARHVQHTWAELLQRPVPVVLTYDHADWHTLLHDLTRLQYTLRQPGISAQALFIGVFMRLLTGQVPDERSFPDQPAWLHRILAFLERGEWMVGGTGVGELAAMARVSPEHFCRVFRAALGMSPQAYLQEQRLQRAETLLVHSDLPVKQIAAAVGIEDAGYFSRLFRRHFLVSPRRYRKEHTAGRWLLAR